MADISAIKLPDGNTYDVVDEKVKVSPTIATSSYYGMLHSLGDDDTSTKYYDLKIKYSFTNGTSESAGIARLTLGNDNNLLPYSIKGQIRLYAESQFVTIDPGIPVSGGATITLPSTSGILALASDIPTKTSDLTNDSGFITSETDPIFSASAAAGITSTDISNWNAKVSDDKTWNGVQLNISSAPTTSNTYYIPSMSSIFDTEARLLTAVITPTAQKIPLYDNSAYLHSTTPSANDNSTKVATTAYVDGAIPTVPTKTSDLTNDSGFITGYTETDPVFTASAAHGISTTDITNWNSKQAALVSGTNIKTINGTSLLGSGDITINGTSTPTADTLAKFDGDARMNSTDMTSEELSEFIEDLNPGGAQPSVIRTIHTEIVTASINIAFANHVSVTAPSVENHRFLCWSGISTRGWVGSVYPEYATQQTTNMWNATSGQSGTGLIDCTALYIPLYYATATSEADKVDFIVEQGTSGIWTYRAWDSGISECWGAVSKTTAYAVWTSPVYYGTTYTGNQTYPTNLFISEPSVTASIQYGGGADVWLGMDSQHPGDETKSPSWYPLRINQSGQANYKVGIYAKGRWK